MTKDEKKAFEALKTVIRDTMWMAASYAHNRSTFAPSTFNEAVHVLDSLGFGDLYDGVILGESHETSRFVDDGMLGKWDSSQKRFIKS